MARKKLEQTQETTAVTKDVKKLTKLEKSKLEKELKIIIPEFYLNNTNMNLFKKKAEQQKDVIKVTLNKLGEMAFNADGYTVTLSNRESVDFNEEALIDYLKKKKIKGVVKKREYIDFDELENLIYNDKINAADLEPYQTKKVTQALTVKKEKGGK